MARIALRLGQYLLGFRHLVTDIASALRLRRVESTTKLRAHLFKREHPRPKGLRTVLVST